MMPDGLTEPLFLLLAAAALLAGCKAVRSGHVGWYILAGLASGLAYLTRAEGLLVAGVTGIVMLALQMSKNWRSRWLVLGRNGTALTTATLLVAVPFMVTIRGLTTKPSAPIMINPAAWPMPQKQPAAVHAPLPLAAWNFGPHVRPEDRYGWAAGALVTMIDKGFFHVLTLPFLAGLILFRRRVFDNPALWVPLALILVLMPLLYRLGQSNGYLGERHVMLIVLCGMYWAVAALGVFAVWLARLTPRVPAVTWATVLLVALTLLPLPKTLARLHGERSGFRQAGEWLAQIAGPDDVVVDPFSWSAYYARRKFESGPPKPPDPAVWLKERARGKTFYVVLDRSRSKHKHLYYLTGPAEEMAKQGRVVNRFSVEYGRHRSEVIVYRVGS
jgi:hypothetical protein